MFNNLRHDASRYTDLGGWYANAGFWIVAIYRLGVWAQSLPFGLRALAWSIYRITRAVQRVLFSVELWAGQRGAHIGPGCCLIHPLNIIIGAVDIGENCLIFHDVTLGTGPLPGFPRIGAGVDIYTGAKVLGGVVVGDHSMIGAGCVVMRDVPPDSIVMPPPARVLPRSLSVCAAEIQEPPAALQRPNPADTTTASSRWP